MIAAAVTLAHPAVQLGRIFHGIVLPILLLAGIGFLLQRRLGLDRTTLRRLNFYFVMPAMVYYAVVTSDLSAGRVFSVVGFALGVVAVMGLLTWVAARLRGVPADLRRPLLMSTILHNSGNFGLPLQELAFSAQGYGADALGLQAFVMITQNLLTFTVGVLLAAWGRRGADWRRNLAHIARFPPVYALAAALLTVQIRGWLGADSALGAALAPLWEVVVRVKGAFVALALLTLGAQLALVARRNHNYPVGMSVFLRLVCGPLVGLAVIYLTGLRGFLAQAMLIASSTPTAVNAMLLCLEFDNHPDYLARAVFYSTLLSPVTVTLTIFVAQGGFLPGF